MRNPHLSEATAAGAASDVDLAWDRGNDQWWDWYMSLADGSVPNDPLVALSAHDPGPLPTDSAVVAELAEPYPLTLAQLRHFTGESFVKLPAVLTPGTAARLRIRLREMLDAQVDPSVGFQSLEMMWLTTSRWTPPTCSPRGSRCTADPAGDGAASLRSGGRHLAAGGRRRVRQARHVLRPAGVGDLP